MPNQPFNQQTTTTRLSGGAAVRRMWRDGFWYTYYYFTGREPGRCFAPGEAC